MGCIKAHGNSHAPCKALSRSYLQCRMVRSPLFEDIVMRCGVNFFIYCEEHVARNLPKSVILFPF